MPLKYKLKTQDPYICVKQIIFEEQTKESE